MPVESSFRRCPTRRRGNLRYRKKRSAFKIAMQFGKRVPLRGALSLKETIMFRKAIASLLATIFFAGAFTVLGSLGGCNAVEGVGRDIESGGTALKEEAREHKRY